MIIADLKGLAYGKEVKGFIRGKSGFGLRSATLLGKDRDKSLEKVVVENGVSLSQVIYFGTCVYDLSALLAVRAGGGLSVILNNRHNYLLNAASLALKIYGNQSAWPVVLLSAVFIKWGIRGVVQMVSLSECPRDIQHLMLPCEWQNKITAGLAKSNFRILIQKPQEG